MAMQIEQRIVGVRFQYLGKLYHYKVPQREDVKTGDYVIVLTNRGKEMGQVINFSKQNGSSKRKLKTIEHRATPKDLVMRRMWQNREIEVMINCRAKASELELQGIKIVKAEFSYDGTRLRFLYSEEGDEKVKLTSLQTAMRRSHRKAKVEFRPIGPRDMAKIIAGMGACGLEERCCSRFLTEFSPISIRMAKAQGISLNPQEITGMCGRLRCCLMYEYKEYVEARKNLPKKKKKVMTPLGEGKVVDVRPLKNAVLVLLPDGKRIEFLKHEIQPYEELKALEEKAKSPCDRHLSGGCNCGKKFM